ncbi:alpha/beta fold hydrolase [Streptosporangium sp. NPDC051022]|uniref:alpha/beta fold hydrolase n=1 Tax=Streptosporangium sp. NPDC051022 TaxID=3155752 RepID=UPI00343005CB
MADITFEGTEKVVETADGPLHYHEVGDGPPVLFLHGSGPGVTGWRNFGENLRSFADRYRCLVLDFPGYGLSHDTPGHPGDASLASVTAFLDALGIERAHVVGNSLGGIVAAQFAIAAPERVDRLVTVGGVGRNILNPFPGEGIRLLVEFTEDPTRERLVQWLRSMVFDPAMVTEELIEQRWRQATEPATLDTARRIYGRGKLEERAAAGAAAGIPPLWAQLHRIKAPTLITWGRDDRVTPLELGLLPMRVIPDVELHVFPNCGHWVMIEQKAAWESTVLAFLDRSAGSSSPA